MKIIKFFSLTTLGILIYSIAHAQAQTADVVKIDTLTKLIGSALAIGGVFMGYLQMKLASKLAELEIKMTLKVASVRDEFNLLIKAEINEVVKTMATSKDIEYVRSEQRLQHENVKLQLQNIKEALNDLKK